MAGLVLILIRADLIQKLGGFDAQFFYYYEGTDDRQRVWEAGYPILYTYTPNFTIAHSGGQPTINRFPPIAFALDAAVTRYLYYYKCHGMTGILSC